jgi:methylglyoxal synthase
MAQRLRIALVAHDAKKDALVGWAKRWEAWLAGHALLGTGSSAGEVERLRSGPEGGDMQVGARIVEGAVDALVFPPDPLNPHEADFRALIRVALLADIPFALSPASADHLARGMSAAEDEGGTAAACHGGA